MNHRGYYLLCLLYFNRVGVAWNEGHHILGLLEACKSELERWHVGIHRHWEMLCQPYMFEGDVLFAQGLSLNVYFSLHHLWGMSCGAIVYDTLFGCSIVTSLFPHVQAFFHVAVSEYDFRRFSRSSSVHAVPLTVVFRKRTVMSTKWSYGEWRTNDRCNGPQVSPNNYCNLAQISLVHNC